VTRDVVLLTRSPEPDGPLLAEIARRGAAPLVVEALRFGPGRDRARLAERVADGGRDWIALTSARAAEALAELLRAGARPSPGARVAVVGDATAGPLAEAGLSPDLVAPAPAASALASALIAKRARSVLFLCGSRARPDLPETLAAAGVAVESLEVYSTEPAPFDARDLAATLDAGRLAASVVASPSAVEAVRDRLSPAHRALWLARPFAASGPTTAGALRALGAGRIAGAAEPSERGLAAALAAALDAPAAAEPARASRAAYNPPRPPGGDR
jgi:uroporphyrinogen-III synthase